MEIVDLSLTIDSVASEPEPAEIEYVSHEEGAEILGEPIGINRTHFPGGQAINLERIKLTSHTGTHLDAPFHYGSHCEGRPARTIESVPLEWCFSDGVLLDLSENFTNNMPVSLKEIKQKLEDINYQIKPMDIVLINTGADQLWGSKEYFTDFRGISLEATKWLLEQGMKIIGVDCFGFDPPFKEMLNRYQETNNPDELWPAHLYGRKKEYCQIERLTNLGSIPIFHGFKVACFPIKVKGSGAGWSRVVAIIDNN